MKKNKLSVFKKRLIEAGLIIVIAGCWVFIGVKVKISLSKDYTKAESLTKSDKFVSCGSAPCSGNTCTVKVPGAGLEPYDYYDGFCSEGCRCWVKLTVNPGNNSGLVNIGSGRLEYFKPDAQTGGVDVHVIENLLQAEEVAKAYPQADFNNNGVANAQELLKGQNPYGSGLFTWDNVVNSASPLGPTK